MTGRNKFIAIDNGSSPVNADHSERGEAIVDSLPMPNAPIFDEERPNEEPAPAEEAAVSLVDSSAGEAPSPSRGSWLMGLFLVAGAAWTGFFAFAYADRISGGASSTRWVEWISQWSIPIVLLIGLWMIILRSSTREIARYSDASRLLANESENLERRLEVINRELSLARDFIAAQSRDLEALGRIASERLSQNADRLQGLIRDNGAEVEVIGKVSASALENMERLKDGLPVISNSARDAASQIGRAGDAAEEQLSNLVAGFQRLNEFGSASARAVDSVRDNVTATLANFEIQAKQMEDVTAARFAELNERSQLFRAELDQRETDAIASIRQRADVLAQELNQRSDEFLVAQEGAMEDLRSRLNGLRGDSDMLVASLKHGHSAVARTVEREISTLQQRMLDALEQISRVDEATINDARARLSALASEVQHAERALADQQALFQANLEQRRRDVASREVTELAHLEERISQFDVKLSERQEQQLAHVEQLVQRGESLGRRLETIGEYLENLANQGKAASDGIALTSADLNRRLEEGRALLEDSEGRIVKLSDSGIRLLDILRSGADQTGARLPEAINQAEQELRLIEDRAHSLSALIAQTSSQGALLTGHVTAATTEAESTLAKIDKIEDRLGDLAAQSKAVASEARGQLDEAMAALALASTKVLERMRDDHAAEVTNIAAMLSAESAAAIDRVLQDNAATVIDELRKATENASIKGRLAAEELRNELSMVGELTGNLERRIEHARERAEEQVDNDFARRMTQITESLNSSTIDITKAFDTEVTDTAWASYLRGDRGIFTRRAVRLLSNQEQRGITEIYDNDGDFRDAVNRYIQDFEAMLRSILSTRDGNSIAVTLLSSDMGKLYVALAQAIERLRR